MKFDFTAVEKQTGRKIPSSITIADPVFVDIGHGGYSSEVTLEGFDSLSTNIHGAFSFQAAGLAFQLVLTLMAAHEGRWAFHFDDGGPITFDWTPPA